MTTETINDVKNFLTIPEAAERYRVSKSYIYKLTSTRSVGFFRIGRRVMFVPEELERFFLSNRIDPQGSMLPRTSRFDTRRIDDIAAKGKKNVF